MFIWKSNLPQQTAGTILLGLILLPIMAAGAHAEIDAKNWGLVTTPVYNKLEKAPFEGADLLAGPRKFGGDYWQAVLPNGRIVHPAGRTVQVGMNPLGCALTPDGKFLVVTCNDEREEELASLLDPANHGGYSLSVVSTETMRVTSRLEKIGTLFLGITASGSGPYTVWASGGPDNTIKEFQLGADGIMKATGHNTLIAPLTPANSGIVSHYQPSETFRTPGANGSLPPVPTSFDRTRGAQITYPAGLALAADGRHLFIACNGDNSLAILDTESRNITRVPVGRFPYSVTLSPDGKRAYVSNWGILEYHFQSPHYSSDGKLTAIDPIASNRPAAFFVPTPSSSGDKPLSSSISIVTLPEGNLAGAKLQKGVYLGKPLDALNQVGDTHPCATALVRSASVEALYVTRANDDSLSIIPTDGNQKPISFDLSPVPLRLPNKKRLVGAYPNALAVRSDGQRVYVAEAGTNTVAVLDTHLPLHPKLLGRIPAGWYPTALSLSPDGETLYIVNAKGVGEDINPASGSPGTADDSNFLFGTVQQIPLATTKLDAPGSMPNNFALRSKDQLDTSVVPIGGGPSKKIKHIFFILHENKTFDSMLGNLSDHFGIYASTTFTGADGKANVDRQFTGVSLNTQRLATLFATGVNYYSDSEESDAGHQFALSGTCSDVSEKTLLVKSGRGLLVNKNFEPEDYPAGGYLFNNLARHHVSFKDYGDMLRIAGTDTGSNKPTILNDPKSGRAGYPALEKDGTTLSHPFKNNGDVTSPTQGLGQSYFLDLPVLAILGTSNPNGEPRIDLNYPGYNFNISDQRRARHFIADFDRMMKDNKLPQLCYIYQPNDHTGSIQAPNGQETGSSPVHQVADGDAGLGMVVEHIMRSPVYYDPKTGEGSVIFITYDDAQSSLDHIHPHRTPLIVVSPFARPGYLGKHHYSTASIIKTEDLLLGLPPNNLGDFFATDLRELFQPEYNKITADTVPFSRPVAYLPSPEGVTIWKLVDKLDTSAPDRDSSRLGTLTRLCLRADDLHNAAAREGTLSSAAYRSQQAQLLKEAQALVSSSKPDDDD